MRFMNFGCGSIDAHGVTDDEWVNLEYWAAPGGHVDYYIDFARETVADHVLDTFDGIISNHVLTQVSIPDVRAILRQLFRCLRPGGVLRIIDADPLWAFGRLLTGGDHQFPMLPQTMSIHEQFCTWMTWHSTRRSVITRTLMWEMLEEAGFTPSATFHGATRSGIEQITALDDREDESYFLEGIKR